MQDHIIEDCPTDTAFSAAFPNIQNGFNIVIRQLAEEPITLPVVDPETKAEVIYLLGSDH